ncbi:MAG: photosynthetic reaction center subunit H [Pararhodobacter sp.]
MDNAIFGNFDLARISLWMFWLFFAALVIWIQRENQREGYPLENDDGTPAGSLWPTPEPKSFNLADGRRFDAPGLDIERRDLAMARTEASGGFPFAPTGDAMIDGVGAAAWVARRDEPEVDGHGHPKLRPMSEVAGFAVASGRNPLGMEVIANDRERPGIITDLWVDVPEQMVRYLQVTLADSSTRLIPMAMARITGDGVQVRSISGSRFAEVPMTTRPGIVTKLEEDKISAFYAGGTLYDQGKRGSKLRALGDLF